MDALANAWPMLGMPMFNLGKPTLGETKLLDTFPKVTMFVIQHWANVGPITLIDIDLHCFSNVKLGPFQC